MIRRELARVAQLADRRVHALGERAVLVEDDAEVLAALGRRELADDDAVARAATFAT